MKSREELEAENTSLRKEIDLLTSRVTGDARSSFAETQDPLSLLILAKNEIYSLRDALAPFAEEAVFWEDSDPNFQISEMGDSLRVSHLIQARKVWKRDDDQGP